MPLLLLALASIAQHPTPPPHGVNGRWSMDTTSLRGNERPAVIFLVRGRFSRDHGPIVAADGKLHHVPGDPYVDEMSVVVRDDHVVEEIDRVRGRLAYTVRYVASADGRTLTRRIANYTNPDGRAVESVATERRLGSAVAGAHAVSGRWRRVSITLDRKSDWILTLKGYRFSWRTENGTGYDAIIGGKAVRIAGDNSGAKAKVTRPQADTIVETDYSPRGRFDDVLSMRLMPDGNTIRASARTRHQRKPTTFVLHRCP